MKTIYTYITSIIIILLTLISCDPFYGWPEFPEERLKSYIPYNKQDSISFKNHKGKYLNVIIENNNVYWEQCNDWGYRRYGSETFHAFCIIKNDSIKIHYDIGNEVGQRDGINAYTNIFYNEQIFDLGNQYFKVNNKDDFEKICLPDTFKTTDPTTNNYSIIVSGKGLIEFSFNEEIWTLVEE